MLWYGRVERRVGWLVVRGSVMTTGIHMTVNRLFFSGISNHPSWKLLSMGGMCAAVFVVYLLLIFSLRIVWSDIPDPLKV
jgi:hypothetical protein